MLVEHLNQPEERMCEVTMWHVARVQMYINICSVYVSRFYSRPLLREPIISTADTVWLFKARLDV